MKIIRLLKRLLYYIEVFVFPERCPYCAKPVEPDEFACKSCLETIKRRHVPIKGGARGFRCVSSFVYDGRVRRVILRIKYRERTQFIPQLAVIAAEDIRKAYPEGFDLITAVPMHKRDLRLRGYNQSVLLAKDLSEKLSVPYADTLEKVKRTRKQHTLKYRERAKNLSGAFRPTDKELILGKRILIVDDIVTSGHTLGACCKTLSKCEPELLCCATIACAKFDYDEQTVI